MMKKQSQDEWTGLYPYRLVIIECNMLHQNGYETTSALRELYRNMGIKPQPYVVGITESGSALNLSATAQELADQAEMNDIVRAPIDIEKIIDCVDALKLGKKYD